MRPTNPDALLVRAIGVRQLAATIFNYTVASGIFRCPGGVLVHLAALGGVVWMLWAIVSRQDLAGVAILLGVTGVAYLLRRRPATA